VGGGTPPPFPCRSAATRPIPTVSDPDLPTLHYRIHGISLEVRGDDEGVLTALDNRLHHFATAAADPAPALRFDFARGDPSELVRPSSEARTVYDVAGPSTTWLAASWSTSRTRTSCGSTT
jgi:hypothetical protein